MKHLTEMKPGETLHLRSGRDLELESVTPVTCGVMLTFNVTERKEHNNERYQNRTYKIHGRALLNLAAVLDELEPLPELRQ